MGSSITWLREWGFGTSHNEDMSGTVLESCILFPAWPGCITLLCPSESTMHRWLVYSLINQAVHSYFNPGNSSQRPPCNRLSSAHARLCPKCFQTRLVFLPSVKRLTLFVIQIHSGKSEVFEFLSTNCREINHLCPLPSIVSRIPEIVSCARPCHRPGRSSALLLPVQGCWVF